MWKHLLASDGSQSKQMDVIAIFRGYPQSIPSEYHEYPSVIWSAIVHAKSDCECVQRGGRRQSSAFCSHFQKTETNVISSAYAEQLQLNPKSQKAQANRQGEGEREEELGKQTVGQLGGFFNSCLWRWGAVGRVWCRVRSKGAHWRRRWGRRFVRMQLPARRQT